MALTVETGEGLPSTDSLVTLEEVRAFASSRGLTVPTPDSELEALVRNAHDYLFFKERAFKGRRKNAAQSLPFPRRYIYIEDELVPDNTIPQCVKNAICQLIVDSQEIDILPIGEGNAVIEEKVGPITTKFAASASADPMPSFPRVLAHLQPVLLAGGRTRTRRI